MDIDRYFLPELCMDPSKPPPLILSLNQRSLFQLGLGTDSECNSVCHLMYLDVTAKHFMAFRNLLSKTPNLLPGCC